MDSRPSRRPRPVVRFIPDRRYTALAGGGAFGALLATLLTSDSGGRLLAALVTAMLVGYVVTDLVFSPRLVASVDGLVVNAPLCRARLSWAEIEDVRAETRFRYGVRSTTLEVDAGRLLAVFSRRALGTDPVAAADLVSAFRPVTR